MRVCCAGKQGLVILDEAAFHDDLEEVLKAAMAFLMWGGKVVVLSTHDGDANPFNELVNDCRAGRKPYHLLRTTLDDAVADGLYKRICKTLDQEWSEGEEIIWRRDLIGFYGDDADEELFCIPSQGTGTALSGALIEMRMDRDIPVLRWEKTDGFSREPTYLREVEALEWCETHLKPLLDDLPMLLSFFGEDFGRVHDLTVIWPVQLQQDLVRRPPFVVELANIPFDQQKQILFYIVERLPRFMAGALDATGNGAYLAEAAADKFGHERIAQVKLSVEWYRENMPRFISSFEDGTVALPRDADLLADHRLLRKVDGVVRVPALRTQDLKNKNKKRHGDSAVAHALCHYATTMDVAPIEFSAAGMSRPSSQLYTDTPDRGVLVDIHQERGFGTVGGNMDWKGY